MTGAVLELDPFDVHRTHRAPALLREFNDAGVLAPADVHVATRLARLAGEQDDSVTLAAALAVRAPRISHVLVDLATIRETATVDADEPVDLSTLPWPDPEPWIERVTASDLVALGEDAPDSNRPLRLVGTWLYLDRYWRDERQVAADLRSLAGVPADDVDVQILHDGIARLFPGQTDGRQALAAATAVLRRFAVVAGGPGTGKTTTVARIVALLTEQATAAGSPPPLIGLAAPTGKAAARLGEAVHDEATNLPIDVRTRDHLLGLHASTLHRLLGWRGSHTRFRYHRAQRLPHDVVIVDEASMVSLSHMARLVEAIRPDARLILVGDPGQLASIEAGAVLGDIVGPATDNLLMSADARALLANAIGHPVPADDPPTDAPIANSIVVLKRVHRFGEGIARLAEAIRRGDADEVLEILHEQPEGVTWIPVDVTDPEAEQALTPIRDQAVAAYGRIIEAARAGAAREALEALSSFRVLCAHRRGPDGVSTWTTRIESWLAAEIPDFPIDTRWYPGRPLLVTENDYDLGLYNGDTGVVVQSTPDRLTAAFDGGGELIKYSPMTLGAVATVYAMTIHKGQGSQFGTAVVLLPAPTSRLLARELLYTAATRAREQLILTGTDGTVRSAVMRQVARASGLRPRLWR